MFFGFFSLKLCAKFWNSMIRIHGKIFSQKWPLLTPLCSGPKMHGLHLSDFFSNVCFQMCPQIVGSRGDKVKSKWVLKLPARERMQSHIACITFSVVYFQMFLQIACLRWRIVALVAFVWLFPCVFLNESLNCLHEKRQSHIGLNSLQIGYIYLTFLTFLVFFLQIFYICINILKSSFHCQCVFCFAQMIGSNWIKKHDWLLNSNNPNFS